MLQTDNNFDLIVIGGGATGSGIALDASLRGLKVLLIEQNDFAEGTSSRSTKLVHGGVRYLEEAVKHFDKEQFALVKEGLRERYKLLKNAPHISHKISLITPVYKWWEVPYIYAGLFLYDIISGKYSLGKSAILKKQTVLSLNKFIKKDGLKAAVRYYDGAFNDARMNIALLQSAQEKGAIVKNYTQVKAFIKEKEKIIGVVAFDKSEKKEINIYAKHIVNATGAFCDTIRKMADKNIKNIIRSSSGAHIVIDKKFLPSQNGIMIPKTKDNRVLFMLPYLGKCLVGTTDNEAKPKEHPKVTQDDIEYLLEHINLYFDIKITKKDILASFTGYRPLVDLNQDENTAKLVREHIIEELSCGLITITGGKWTTYRNMAEGLVDKLTDKECLTDYYKVVGSREDLSIIFEKIEQIFNNKLLSKRLISLYGDRAIKIALMAKELEEYSFLDNEYQILKVEVIYCVRFEYVKKPLDFLTRRIQLSMVDVKKAIEILDDVLFILKNEFGWNEMKYNEEKKYALELLDNEFF